MKRCYLVLCMPIGITLLLMPSNGSSAVLGGIATGLMLGLRAVVTFLGVLLVRYGYSVLARVTKKLILRGTVLQLMRIYVLMHPGISNARVRRMKAQYVARAKTWLTQARGIRLVFVGIAFLSAAIGAWAVIVLVGVMRILYLLVEPVFDAVARTVVGKALVAWWTHMTGFMCVHVRGPYRVWRDRYYQHNRGWLRRASHTYREKVHKRPRIGA